MSVIEINSLDDPRVAVFGRLTEAQLRNRLHPEQGIFIAESPKVITTALDAGYEPVSLLCERRHIDGDAASIIGQRRALCDASQADARCRDALQGCEPCSRD